MPTGSIKAVLFDSGDTLLEPIGGAWWPRPALRAVLDQSASRVEPGRLSAALDRGMEFLDTHHHVETEDEEIAQFRECYAIVLGRLDLDARSEMIEKLAHAQIEQRPFPDTRPTLEELRREGLRLGIVSNAWPSLERTYRTLGLRDFFDAFVISSRVGCMKPDPRIYRVAVEQIGVYPESIVFVDDDTEYVRAAESLGMLGVVIQRGASGASSVSVSTLADLKALIWAG
ncbi:MAG TPA: HAD family phosphatase [Candidatus Binatus sp.]|nr:HAD family phosphatase [Candidatus Binatus sp.]